MLTAGSSTSNAYVLRSLLPAAIREKYVEAGTVQYDKGFAMVVFSLLSTNAGKIAEGELVSTCTMTSAAPINVSDMAILRWRTMTRNQAPNLCKAVVLSGVATQGLSHADLRAL